MLGDRLLNGTETKFSLPTPIDILNHEYFADYKRPIPMNKKFAKKGKSVNKPPACVFSYTMPESTVDVPIITLEK